MQIWVDADACPNPIKEILFRVANRTSIPVTLVANQHIACPPSKYIKAIQVPKGFDVADNEIVRRVAPGDLVITQDIPLAAEVIAKDAHAIHPRGELFSKENMAERLALRDLTETLRGGGMIEGGGPRAFAAADRANFANALDRFLASHR